MTTANVTQLLLACLRAARASGLSSAELAARLYNETGSAAQGRVAMLIGNLRRKGFTIDTVIIFDGKNRVGKYILHEPEPDPVKNALTTRPIDIPSPRSRPDDPKRGAR
jgi:hypothetical protein